MFINYTRAMVQPSGDACRAWQLLVRFFFAQREHLPTLDGELELSPIQCHVLHLLEPGRPLPMGRLAGMLGCHASNVTGLVDRLEARGVVLRRPSADDRRVKVLDLTPEGVAVAGSGASSDDDRCAPAVQAHAPPTANAREDSRSAGRRIVKRERTRGSPNALHVEIRTDAGAHAIGWVGRPASCHA